MAYPDVEKLLVATLPARIGGVRVLTETPANLAGAVPVIQVTRFGGGDTAPGIDRPNVDFDVFAATRAQAFSIAEKLRYALLYVIPGQRLDAAGTATIARVDTISGPSIRPYDNTALRRVGASYQLTLHAKTIREVVP